MQAMTIANKHLAANRMFEILHKLSQSFEFAIAGIFGAVVASPFHSESKTRRGFAVFVISGAATAHFMTGLVADFFTVNAASAGGVGFLLGAFGGSLIAAALKVISEGELWTLIKIRIGGGGQ